MTKSSEFAIANPEIYDFFHHTEGFCFPVIFPIFYLSVLAYTIMLSVGAPLEKVIGYYGFVSVIFSSLGIFSIINAIIKSFNTSYFIPDQTWDAAHNKYVDVPGSTHLSIMAIIGPLLLSAFALPFILRPLDFLQNFRKYIVGLICYIALLPVFSSVLQIYAMSNLHDVSWGNRPAAATPEAIAQMKKMEKLQNEYKVFRSNFLTFWIVANGTMAVYFDYQSNNHTKSVKDVHEGAGAQLMITFFGTSYLLYRLIFALILSIRFKIMHTCLKKYRVQTIEQLEAQAKKDGKTAKPIAKKTAKPV